MVSSFPGCADMISNEMWESWSCHRGSALVDLMSFCFQAEDGIRDVAVTGVQTCALPILWRSAILIVPNSWVLGGNGTQADGVNELEDGGVGADSESKGEDGDEGEAGTEAKKPQSMAKVAPERGHSIPLAVSDDRRDRMSRGLSTENSDRAAVISERGGGREPLPSEGKTRVFTILQIFEIGRASCRER